MLADLRALIEGSQPMRRSPLYAGAVSQIMCVVEVDKQTQGADVLGLADPLNRCDPAPLTLDKAGRKPNPVWGVASLKRRESLSTNLFDKPVVH